MTKTTITISISNRECRGYRKRRGRRNTKIFPSPHNYQNPEYLRLMADVRETDSVTTCGLAPQIDEFLRKKPEYHRFSKQSFENAYDSIATIIHRG